MKMRLCEKGTPSSVADEYLSYVWDEKAYIPSLKKEYNSLCSKKGREKAYAKLLSKGFSVSEIRSVSEEDFEFWFLMEKLTTSRNQMKVQLMNYRILFQNQFLYEKHEYLWVFDILFFRIIEVLAHFLCVKEFLDLRIRRLSFLTFTLISVDIYLEKITKNKKYRRILNEHYRTHWSKRNSWFTW